MRSKYGAINCDHFIITTLHIDLTRLGFLGHDLEKKEQPKFDSYRMLHSIITYIANILQTIQLELNNITTIGRPHPVCVPVEDWLKEFGQCLNNIEGLNL